MTTQTNTTPTSATTAMRPLLAQDQLVFRKALDHLEEALKADWQVFLRRDRLNTPDALEFGHEAAQAWSMCLEALRDVRDMETAHADLREAASELIQTTPGFHPHALEVIKCRGQLTQLWQRNQNHDPGLHDLLFEAFALSDLHYTNLLLVQPPAMS